MKVAHRLIFISFLFMVLSVISHFTMPNQKVDIQLHDTYFVTTVASIFFPFIFFFMLFGLIHLYLRNTEIHKSKISKYYYWISLSMAFLIIAGLFAKSWWISQGLPPKGSPEFYSLIKFDSHLTRCFLVLLALFLIFQFIYLVYLTISVFKKAL